jgi:hypothetical protein
METWVTMERIEDQRYRVTIHKRPCRHSEPTITQNLQKYDICEGRKKAQPDAALHDTDLGPFSAFSSGFLSWYAAARG